MSTHSALRGSFRRELSAVLKQGELIVRAARPENDGTGASLGRGERLVVFVHGFMARGPVWGPMREAVVAAHDVETIDLSYGPLETFDAVCDRVRRLIERLHADRPVTLVGHSLGGLVSRRIVQTDDAVGARIDRLVTLASPHEGTRAARLPAGPLVAAIRPGSSVIRALDRDRHLLERVHRVAVVASRDRMITPPSSAAQLPGAEVVWLDVGHNEILFDPDAIALVKMHIT